MSTPPNIPLEVFLFNINAQYSLNLTQSNINTAMQQLNGNSIHSTAALWDENIMQMLEYIIPNLPTLIKAIQRQYATANAAAAKTAFPAQFTPAPVDNKPATGSWGAKATPIASQSAAFPTLGGSKAQFAPKPTQSPLNYSILSAPAPTSAPTVTQQQSKPVPVLTQVTSPTPATVSQPVQTSKLSENTALFASIPPSATLFNYNKLPEPIALCYLPGKYRRETLCRFCETRVVIGVNDYTTLTTRTTQVYQFLKERAVFHQEQRSKYPLHTQSQLYHRQPQPPFILEATHPLPLPLPTSLHDVCDGGLIVQMEQKIVAMLTAHNQVSRKKITYQLDADGFVPLSALSALLNTFGSAELLNLFETPPYPVSPLPDGTFVQGEDRFGIAGIPDCIQRMQSVCTRVLPCGCPCNGLRGELPTDCPLCPIHELTQEQRDMCGEDCMMCMDSLSHGPTFLSGTYQHLWAKPSSSSGRAKLPDVALPFYEYLYKLGLNGNYVDYSKAEPKEPANCKNVFEIDNYHAKNFSNSKELMSKAGDFVQPVAGQEKVAKQTWEHENLPPPLAFLTEQTVCKHMHHYQCFMQQLQTNWGTGNRIQFNYLRCPACRLHIFHPLLVPYLIHHYVFEQFVNARALQRLRDDKRLYDHDLINPHSEFYENRLKYALKQYVFYLCSICQKPYFGGAADCQMDMLGDGDNAGDPALLVNKNNALVCLSCNPTPGKTCDHSDDYMVNKCKFCCSLSTYVCWSNTWFCDKCHDPKVWQKLVYSRTGKNKLDIAQYHQCPSIERQIKALQNDPEFTSSPNTQMEKLRLLRCDPKECPLKVAHPPNGFNFVINCKQCESEGLTENPMAAVEEDSDDEGPTIVRLQGVKTKRVKATRKKGPRIKLVRKPIPYIVTLFEMDLKIFHQLSLYSYLYLYRVLYDKHMLLPSANVYSSYLHYNQHGLSRANSAFNNMLQASKLVDRIQFIDILPMNTIRNDNVEQLVQATPHSGVPLLGGSTVKMMTSTDQLVDPSQPLFTQYSSPPQTDAILNNQRIVMKFTYNSEMDHNGIIYFLGTLAHTQQFLNPHKRGLVECSCTTEQADYITLPPWGLLERGDVRHVSQDRENVEISYILDLKLLRMIPTHYTLKHYATYDAGCVRSWMLEGYNNGTWYTIDQRENDYSINGRNSSATFAIKASPISQKYFSQFRIRHTGPNSRHSWFLAVNGFDLYGTVQFPTISELLQPSFLHYRDSATKFSEGIPRITPPPNAHTASVLLPNVVRFVLDSGLRFASHLPPAAKVLDLLWEEDSVLRARNHAHQKLRHHTAADSHFLTIPLPAAKNSPLQQFALMVRNFSHHSSYHNNRFDIAFVFAYNEPLQLALITVLEDLSKGDAGLKSPAKVTGDLNAKVAIVETNTKTRAAWGIVKKFNGAIIPTVDYINQHLNLPARDFAAAKKDLIISQVNNKVSQDKATSYELNHQNELEQIHIQQQREAEAAEVEASRQRKQQQQALLEKQRDAERHRLDREQREKDEKEAAKRLEMEEHDRKTREAAQEKARKALEEKEKKEKLEREEKEKKERLAREKAEREEAERNAKEEQARKTAEEKTAREQAAHEQAQREREYSFRKITQAIDKARSASPEHPLLVYKTPSAIICEENYQKQRIFDAETNPQILTVDAGGLFYYLGTLNHTDLVNLQELQANPPRRDADVHIAFRHTNPQKLGALMITASQFAYQVNALYSIANHHYLVKHQVDTLGRVFPVNLSPRTHQPLRIDSQDELCSWVLFDFGVYRVNLSGYLLNTKGLSTGALPTRWVIEGSDGYVPPDDLSTQTGYHPISRPYTSRSADGWTWTTLISHNEENRHINNHVKYDGLFFVDFLQKQPNTVMVNKTALSEQTDHAFRYIRFRNLDPQECMTITGMEFFGDLYTTVPSQDAPTHNDLQEVSPQQVFSALPLAAKMQLWAQHSLFFYNGLVIQSFPKLNGGAPPNGIGVSMQIATQNVQQMGADNVKFQNLCVYNIPHPNNQLSHRYCLLPSYFNALFSYWRYAQNDPSFTSYSMAIPGLFVNTFSTEDNTSLFKYLNYFSAGPHSSDFTSGNLFKQLELLSTQVVNLIQTLQSIGHLSHPPRYEDVFPQLQLSAKNMFIAPQPTTTDPCRFTTAVYTSSTDARRIITKSPQDSTAVVPSLTTSGEARIHTQFTLPSLLTSQLSNKDNNIVWSSEPADTDPWVIIDLGPFQRFQLSAYTFSVFAAAGDNIGYPRTFQLFGSITGKEWHIISHHSDDLSLNENCPTASWMAPQQKITNDQADLQQGGYVFINPEDTFTSYGAPIYLPAYRFFAIVGGGPNSIGGNALTLSNVDFCGLVISSSAPLSAAPFPCEPSRYDVVTLPRFVRF